MALYTNILYQNELKKEAKRTEIDWKQLQGKRILITGASGMIGSYLVDIIMQRNRLYQNAIMLYAMSRNKKRLEARFGQYAEDNNFMCIEQDVSTPFGNELPENIDYIIHAASNTHPKEYSADPVGTITTNVFGSYYLLEYARRNKGCRVVFLSSVEIYGENKGDTELFDELYMGYLDCNTMRAGYPESKRITEAMMQAYISQYEINAVSVRLSRIYGAALEKDDSKALTQFIRKAVVKEDIVLKSKGDQLFSYTYLPDAVRAILMIMLKGESGLAYNVADDASDVTLRDIAAYLATLSGVNVEFQIPQASEAAGYSTATKALLDASKLKKELDWKAYYSMEDGLRRTLEMLALES